METMIREEMTGIMVVAVAIALPIATIPLAVYASLNKMSGSPALKRREDLVPEVTAALTPNVATFLNAIGFKFSAAYSFHASRIGIWQQQGATVPRRIFSFSQTSATKVIEFVTQFSDGYSLTTTTTR